MKSRPARITAVSWFIIVTNLLAVLSMAYFFESQENWDMMAVNMLPVVVQRSLIMFSLGISILCGFMMLEGANWARWLYIIWNGAHFAIQLVSTLDKLMLVPGLVVFGVLVALLLSRPANQFFAREKSNE